MELKDIISALVAFLFGLLAKFIYDIWSERRKRKTLLIRKSTLTSFTLGSLEKDIREKIEVLFEKHPIKSIQLVRVSMENSGFSAIKNQAVTIKFGDKAQIIGEPISKSSSEDLRYIKYDYSASTFNKRRILFELLRKGAKVSWDFAVINHDQNDFIVEHGISKNDKEITDNDLDVVSTIANEKISPDLSGRIKRIFTYLIFTQIMVLLRDSFLQNMLQIAAPVINAATIIIWILLIQEVTKSIIPITEWLRETFSPKEKSFQITIEGDVTDSNIIIGDTNSINTAKFDQKVLREFLDVLDSQNEKPKLTKGAKK